MYIELHCDYLTVPSYLVAAGCHMSVLCDHLPVPSYLVAAGCHTSVLSPACSSALRHTPRCHHFPSVEESIQSITDLQTQRQERGKLGNKIGIYCIVFISKA